MPSVEKTQGACKPGAMSASKAASRRSDKVAVAIAASMATLIAAPILFAVAGLVLDLQMVIDGDETGVRPEMYYA